MGRHVEQRAAPRQVGVPEVVGVRTTVPFARPECREATDRPRLDHLAHPDHLGVEDDVLEIGAEDPGFRHEAEHLGRFLGVPSERFGAGDALAVPGCGANGLEMEVVRERDDDEVDLRIGADGIDRVERPAAEAGAKRFAPLRSGAPVGHDPSALDVAQALRVELADEPGAEHPDADVAHDQYPSPAVAAADAAATGCRARLPRPEVVDDRLRRRRPDAGRAEGHHLEQGIERSDAAGGLHLDVGRGVGAHQPEIVVRGAAGGETGRRLHEVGSGRLRQAAGPDLLVVGQVGVLEDHLDDCARRVGDVDDRRDVGLDVRIAAGLERADLDDHVELGGAVAEGSHGLEDLRLGAVVAVREADDRPDRDIGPLEDRPGAGHVRRPDADRRHVVLSGQAAAVLNERIVELRSKKTVIDRLGDVALRQGFDAERHGLT